MATENLTDSAQEQVRQPGHLPNRWRDRVRSHRRELIYLRLLSGVLGLWALTASAGWYSAGQAVRISIPPNLPYGGSFTSNTHHPWEIFNFAGYIWQQYSGWSTDGSVNASVNLQRLAAFFTPAEQAQLKRELEMRQQRGEVAGRIRTVRPYGVYTPDKVRRTGPDSWLVRLDQHVAESIDGIVVKQGLFRYSLKVLAADLDPERNPWGLLLAGRQEVRRIAETEEAAEL